ncbi:conserved hypothetical protein [Leishmania mexicana MHOM/GT/2001/U1103]|uniref:Sfi1 spindle body domain-containing protein n=1 Tax=Leishmania mexicana (strain MHOM/GT/2001/U1103) TaxID=929439 RepID=E9B6Q1_LEIMU|nr:conserved hypothetical protein [Leishmania mexicana MHOM/GT/2001/U1103]CBZ30923.1 conserved hypothetical protein [Leishmania mexicana MHOM/GT/2001/U1103]
MRHCPARIHNFYEDDDVESVTAQSGKQRRFAPSPRPFSAPSSSPRAGSDAQSPGLIASSGERNAFVQQAERSESSRSSSSSCSSASIERVIHCDGTTSQPGFDSISTHSLFIGEALVSLRQLQESVEEAVRDVRRLDMLTRKAVWHALTRQPSSRDARLHRRTTTTSVHKVSPGVRRSASTSAEVHHGAEGYSESTALVHEKPFLPPDRYPTTPALQDTPDHFTRNLFGSLFAAHRAGLFEQQRAWMQRRLPRNTTEAPAVAEIPSSSPASTRRTALQRVSSLKSSATAAPRSSRTTVASGGSCVGAPTADAVDVEEERVRSSVSLIILRVAKDRAIATVFLRQLRLEAYKRRALRENVDLRYSYYVQRRLLRRWSDASVMQRRWRVSLLTRIILHWQRFVQTRKALRGVLSSWRRLLQQRQQAQSQRCFKHWLRTFTWHRERGALYETASQFAASRQRWRHGQTLLEACDGGAEVLALLQGRPRASGSGTVVVTAVGPRLLLRRLFLAWRQRTEWRLMAHLAAWHYVRQMRANVVRRMCSCARRVALQHYRSRPEHQRQRVAPAAHGVGAGSSVVEEPSRAPRRVCIVSVLQRGLLKYKVSAALCIAHAAQLRRCFDWWHIRVRARRADRFHLQCVYAYVVCRWLQALAAHRARRQRKRLILSRWVAATEHCQAAAVAWKLHAYQLARHALRLWRSRLTVRLTHQAQLLQGCFERWRDRTLLRRAARALQRTRQHGLLRQWHCRAQARVQVRTNLYVADTISETALVLGCFRRWRFRAAERHRARLAWDVLVQLRRERLSRRCFDVWRRRTLAPALPWARHLKMDRSSSPMSLLV